MTTLKSIFANKLVRGSIWFLIRLYLGYEWLNACMEKLGKDSAVWVGAKAGTGVKGFLSNAVSPAMTSGDHPSVLGWYAWLVNHVFLPNSTAFSYMVAYGELLIGIAIILGLFTRFTVFFAAFLNLNFMLAGSTGINVPMFAFELSMLLVGGTAGLIGVDYFIMPTVRKLAGRVFGRKAAETTAAPEAAPALLPIDKQRYIESEHKVETPHSTDR